MSNYIDNMEKAIAFGLTLINIPYCAWNDSILIENEPPSWACLTVSDKIDYNKIKQSGMFCAGLVNLMLRHVNLLTPKYPPYNGGIYSYQINYKMIPFDLNKVERGDAVFRKYFDVNDQGHIGIALGTSNDRLLQCFSDSDNELGLPGVNISYSVVESHDSGYYQYIIKARDLWTR